MRCVLVIAPLCLAITSCGVVEVFPSIPMTPEERTLVLKVQGPDIGEAKNARAELVASHPNWNDTAKAAVARGEVAVGMTRFQVRCAWGFGSMRQMHGGWIIDNPPRERWMYDRPPILIMAYFKRGLLVDVAAFDEEANRVPIDRGDFGFRLPPSTKARSKTMDLFLFAQQCDPDWE